MVINGYLEKPIALGGENTILRNRTVYQVCTHMYEHIQPYGVEDLLCVLPHISLYLVHQAMRQTVHHIHHATL